MKPAAVPSLTFSQYHSISLICCEQDEHASSVKMMVHCNTAILKPSDGISMRIVIIIIIIVVVVVVVVVTCSVFPPSGFTLVCPI
jgi:hypothetical protein